MISVGTLYAEKVVVNMKALKVVPIANVSFAIHDVVSLVVPIMIMNAFEVCVMTVIRKVGSVCGVIMMTLRTFGATERANTVLTVTRTAIPDAVFAARRNCLTRTTSLLLSPKATG